MGSVSVTFDPTVADDRTVHMPRNLAPADRPKRALIWSTADEAKTRAVVRMSATRPGAQKAAVGASLFESLGGQEPGDVACTYRAANTWTLVRYDAAAAGDAAIAVLGALAAAAAAWLTMDKAVSTESGARWAVSIAIFLVGLVLTTLKLRKELRDIGP